MLSFFSSGHPQCGQPEQPIYGTVKIAGEFGHYSCIPGYTMRGNATRRCSWKGWEGQVPECTGTPRCGTGFKERISTHDEQLYSLGQQHVPIRRVCKMFSESSTGRWAVCSCHAGVLPMQAMGTCKNILHETLGTSFRPRLY